MKIGNSVVDPSGCFIFDMQTHIDKMRDVRWDQMDLEITIKLNKLAREMMDHNRYVHVQLKRFLNENR